MNNSDNTAPPWSGVILFFTSVIALLVGFLIPAVVGLPLSILAIVPVIYGSHEALHETLIPRRRGHSFFLAILQNVALTFGFALQLMNFRLLRPAHWHHHTFGRYDEGYAPDVLSGKPTIAQSLRYYLSLCGRPALLWQAAGFLAVLVPPRFMPMGRQFHFEREKTTIPLYVPQIIILLFLAFAIHCGGVWRFAVFEVALIFVWSVLQNVSHYGLKGVDPFTDRVCARSYILERPFHFLTFGSTMHLAHHVDEAIPGLLLQSDEVIASIENRLGVQIVVKRGIVQFLLDVARQFKGPMHESKLTTEWLKTDPSNLRDGKYVAESFSLRAGRTWRIDQDVL